MTNGDPKDVDVDSQDSTGDRHVIWDREHLQFICGAVVIGSLFTLWLGGRTIVGTLLCGTAASIAIIFLISQMPVKHVVTLFATDDRFTVQSWGLLGRLMHDWEGQLSNLEALAGETYVDSDGESWWRWYAKFKDGSRRGLPNSFGEATASRMSSVLTGSRVDEDTRGGLSTLNRAAGAGALTEAETDQDPEEEP